MDGEIIVCQHTDSPLALCINFACVLDMCQGVAVCIYIKMWNIEKVVSEVSLTTHCTAKTPTESCDTSPQHHPLD